MAQRRVLITGAGSGLGRALALRHALAGDRVACVDLDPQRASEACAELAGSGHLAIAADVADSASMQQMAEQVVKDWAGVDLLYNNAGVASGGCLLNATDAEWRRVLEVNLLGVVRGCQLFLPGMLAQGQGQIVNTASFAGLAGAPNAMTYGVSKAAVVALSEQLRAETVVQGVAVSVICPGFFQTNLLQNFYGDARVRGFGERMMQRSADSLDAVADRVFAAVARRQFMIIPTRWEPWQWRLKRWLPGVYFNQLKRMAQRMAAAKSSKQ